MTSSHGSPSSRTPDWADLTMHAGRKRRVTAPAAGGWLGGGGGVFRREAVVASGSCCSQPDCSGVYRCGEGEEGWGGCFV